MLGCYAEALSRDFTIDRNEIEDARWLTKDEVPYAPRGRASKMK